MWRCACSTRSAEPATSCTIVALTNGDGETVGILGTLVDDTERRLAEMSLRSSEELHRLTIANLPGTAVGLYDRELRCLLMEGVDSLGFSTAALRGKHISEITPPEGMPALMPGIEAALAGEEYSGELYLSEQATRWSFQTAPYFDDSRQITGFIVVGKDVTEQRKAEMDGRRSDALFRLAFDHAPIGMAIIGLDERFHQVNGALEEMLGGSADALTIAPVFDLCHPDDCAGAKAAFADLLTKGQANGELRLRGAGDTTIWVDARTTLINDDNGNPLHVLAQIQDITDRHARINRLEHMVVHDPLTGLSNTRGFETALAAQISVNRRYGERGSLMVIDLDNFKQVNDTFGHATGDDLLVAAADALRDRLRDSDIVARLGGDEFAIILPEQDVVAAEPVAHDLIVAITARAESVGHGLPEVTASVGLTTLCRTGLTTDEALVRADHAMYTAKRAGKNRVAIYDETTSTRTAIPTGSVASSDAAESS